MKRLTTIAEKRPGFAPTARGARRRCARRLAMEIFERRLVFDTSLPIEMDFATEMVLPEQSAELSPPPQDTAISVELPESPPGETPAPTIVAPARN
jgi:hypothetical protein